MAASTVSRAPPGTGMFSERASGPAKRKQKEARTDIWTSLLKQTHEAQARRSRTSAMQHRSLLVCGGLSSEDQRNFLQGLARPPPTTQLRNQERGKQQQQQRSKGEVRLSNTYAYGYGHVTLYSPPTGQIGAVLGAEAEEAARLLVHTIPAPDREFVPLTRRLLSVDEKTGDGLHNGGEGTVEASATSNEDSEGPTPRPAVCILLSWKQPWKFMSQLRDWIQLLAQALLPPNTPATDPVDVLREAQLAVTVVVQHTEAQEDLFREGYKEEDFDYISQCLRTALLPLHPRSGLVYLSSTAPPQQPGSPLTEPQKVIYTSLDLNLATLSPKPPRSAGGESTAVRKEELNPKHEFMDRMAIVIPLGWDSAAFIRTLSETFSPEDVLNAWLADLQPPPPVVVAPVETESSEKDKSPSATMAAEELYASASPIQDTFSSSPPPSPSKQAPSTIRQYELKVLNPQAHKLAPTGPPPIETTTKPTQAFLSEMRSHLQELEAQDRERNTDSSSSTTRFSGRGAIGMPAGEQSGALDDLGDVSFNVGGVSYDAGRAIERLKRPPLNLSSGSMGESGPLSPGSRISTPRPRPAVSTPRLDGTPNMSGSGTAGSGIKDLPVDKLEEYFASLMKKGSGAMSRDSTPTRPRGGGD